MSDIQVRAASDLFPPEKIALTDSHTGGPDGGYVPGRLAGYVWDGAAYCPECASEVTAESPDGEREIPLSQYPAFETDPHGFGVGIVNGMDEADYPGYTCHVCHLILDTNVLVYREGPGSELFEE